MEEFIEYKPINGQMMRKFINKPAKMFIKVTDASPGGNMIEGITTDKVKLSIELNNALSQPVQNWIEIQGIVKSTTAMKANNIISFEQDENSEPFDESAHNEICIIFDHMNEDDFYRYI